MDSKRLKLVSNFKPAGDQPQAIKKLVGGITAGEANQMLLGVTGSGKTFTIAHVIEQTQKPTLILAPNKTLAAQLYEEMKGLFPNNAVAYFVSYYDYYQPEAYVPNRDLYIEKEATINEQIDRLRHAATRYLLERRDVIIVASVSCIYGIGSPESYAEMRAKFTRGMEIDRDVLLKGFVELHYKRNAIDFSRGSFRVRGDSVEIFPAHLEDRAWRFSFFGDEIEAIIEFDPLTGERTGQFEDITLYANSHYVTPHPTLMQAVDKIKIELNQHLVFLRSKNMMIEAQRLEERTQFDLEMIVTTGSCSGIENYSRYLTGRNPGEAPPTLFEYLPKDALLILDESHVMIPQLRAMYKGDFARKTNLCAHGFRLPSAMDNRPLKFEEWDRLRPQSVFVSATPAEWELTQTQGEIVEQIVRPTGLLDPAVEIRPVELQVDDLLDEVQKTIKKGLRILVTTLTKKMAEALTDYMMELDIKVRYLHSDVETLERIEIIHGLRAGEFDVLIGINLLREGLDIPECGLVAILDADKEGYLRSKTSLIQTIGRAARNVEGRVILYADKETKSIKAALEETNRRRKKQAAYNKQHGITPTTIKKILHKLELSSKKVLKPRLNIHQDKPLKKQLQLLQSEMKQAASNLEFERAAYVRDEIKALENYELGI